MICGVAKSTKRNGAKPLFYSLVKWIMTNFAQQWCAPAWQLSFMKNSARPIICTSILTKLLFMSKLPPGASLSSALQESTLVAKMWNTSCNDHAVVYSCLLSRNEADNLWDTWMAKCQWLMCWRACRKTSCAQELQWVEGACVWFACFKFLRKNLSFALKTRHN